MHRFVRCQTHPACPDIVGWYLVLEPNDLMTIMDVHRGVAGLYFNRYNMDPHLREPALASHYNPVRLATLWLETVEKLLQEGPIVVNSSGGCLLLDEVKVVAEQQSDKLVWPNYYEDEIITISRWEFGHHYWLASNKHRVFVPSKYKTYQKAHAAASNHTNNIKARGC